MRKTLIFDLIIGSMTKDDLFKITPIEGNITIDKRKTISPFNSVKHLKTANIPALCDQCVYRSIDDGGNGKCPKYEKAAVCAIREDFVKFINDLDTRNPEDLKAMIDMLAKLSFENVLMALTQAKMDGNIPDRNTKSEINTLLSIVKSINDLNSKIVVTERTEFDKTGDKSKIGVGSWKDRPELKPKGRFDKDGKRIPEKGQGQGKLREGAL